MSHIDAALRRARTNKAATFGNKAADWQDFTPAVYPSLIDLERLPSETPAAAGVEPAPLRPAVAAVGPTTSGAVSTRPIEPPAVPAVSPEPAARPPAPAREAWALVSAEVSERKTVADPVVPAAGKAERMFEALDRVLVESPLASSRRAVRRTGHGRDEQGPRHPDST